MKKTAGFLLIFGLLGPLASSPAASDETHSIEELYQALMPSSCSEDMVIVGEPGAPGTFCIEANQRSNASYRDAVITCAMEGRHVCTRNEWWTASTTEGVNNMCNHDWEWVGDQDHAYSSGHLQIMAGGAECTRMDWAWTDQHNNGEGSRPYRCCQGGITILFD